VRAEKMGARGKRLRRLEDKGMGMEKAENPKFKGGRRYAV